MDDSSKRLDLIRNNLRPPLETAFLPPRIPDFQAAERSLPLENPAARNGIFGCRDRRPKIGSSSLLKNLEMESFCILAGGCWGGAVELDVILQPGVGFDAGWLSGKQFGNADQVIGDQIEQEVGGDASDAAMFGLAHGAVLLAPTEDALDHRPARLRHAITRMP